MTLDFPLRAASWKDRAAGRSRYTADLIPGDAVVAGMVRSACPHARIKHIDSRAALAVPGVLGVLVPDDFQGVLLGRERADEPVLTSVARYVGDGIAAVAAIDLESLDKGIEALKIEYDTLPHALGVDDALQLATPIHAACKDNVAEDFAIARGDWEPAAGQVAAWAENTFDIGAVPHAYLEPRACLVHASKDHLRLVVGSHSPSIMADLYRPVVESWGAKLEISTPDIGGSFGAKWEHPTHLVCLAFAHRLGRDVAMVLPRRDDMIAGRTRVAMRIRMRIGAAADGRLLAKETTVWADNGAYSLHGPAVARAAAIRIDNLYRFAAVKARAQLVYTNNLPSECFRGFGIPQSCFAQEQLIDELARRLDLDPVEIRRMNAVRSQETSIHGWKIGSCGFEDCLDAVSTKIAAHRKTQLPEQGQRYRYGYGIAAAIHCISNQGHDEAADRALITLHAEPGKTIRIGSGEIELGCGTVEVIAATVARELGIDRQQLDVVLGDTTSAPYGLGSFASRTSFFTVWAAMDACKRFKDACRQLAADLGLAECPDVADLIALAEQHACLDQLEVTGSYEPSTNEYPDSSGYGNISPGYTFGVHGCCLKIDTDTGKASVEKYWAAHDAGTIVSRIGATGQVIGGVQQGIGFAMTEVTAVDENGRLLNPGYLDNRIATFADAVPVDVFFAPTHEKTGPAGAKTIGEMPIIPVAACVANAVYDAIGVRQTQLPMNSERVWRSLREDAEKTLPSADKTHG